MMAESRVNPYSPILENEQDLLIDDDPPRSVPVLQMNTRTRNPWKRNAAIVIGVVLVVGLLGGVLGALLVQGGTATSVANAIIPSTPQPLTTPPTTTTTTTTTQAPTTTKKATTTPEPPTPPPSAASFPPPTKHPLPKDAHLRNPISLLYEMSMDPTFTKVTCGETVPPVFRYNVTVSHHTFTSLGANRLKDAKAAAAMAANEALFGIRYPGIRPTSVCKVVESQQHK